MTILYPVHEGFMLQKARDARIIRLSHALAQAGQRVYLLRGWTTRSDEEVLKYYGLSPLENFIIVKLPMLRSQGWIRLTINGVFLWAAYLKARAIARRESVDVLYFSVLEVADFFLKRKKHFPNAKFIFELHELARYPEIDSPSPRQIREEKLEGKILGRMDGVFTTTAVLGRVVATRHPRIPCATIPLGMIPPADSPPAPVMGAGKVKVGYIGQLYDAQGIDILIQAMSLLPQAEAHIIGGTIAQCDFFRTLAKNHGVGERVYFHGFIEPGEIPERMKNIDILVVPSRNTIRMNYVAHIKIYEYMAAQRPIVSTRLKSIEEELDDGKTAILVEPDDPQSLAQGIQRLIADPDLARAIARRSYIKSAEYHWERRAVKIVDFIQSLNLH